MEQGWTRMDQSWKGMEGGWKMSPSPNASAASTSCGHAQIPLRERVLEGRVGREAEEGILQRYLYLGRTKCLQGT